MATPGPFVQGPRALPGQRRPACGSSCCEASVRRAALSRPPCAMARGFTFARKNRLDAEHQRAASSAGCARPQRRIEPGAVIRSCRGRRGASTGASAQLPADGGRAGLHRCRSRETSWRWPGALTLRSTSLTTPCRRCASPARPSNPSCSPPRWRRAISPGTLVEDCAAAWSRQRRAVASRLAAAQLRQPITKASSPPGAALTRSKNVVAVNLMDAAGPAIRAAVRRPVWLRRPI